MADTPSEREDKRGWGKLRSRKVVQWGVAYVAVAWGFLQGLEYVSEAFAWPGQIRQVAILALLVGLPIALVIAWYHGDRGEQRVSRTELIIITLLFVLGGGAIWRYEHALEALPTATQTTAVVAPDRSIAVLPFVNMSDDPANEYFSDGISEELLNLLANVPEVRVISRSSAFAFKGKDLKLTEIAGRLHVAHVLEGSVRKAGNRVRITAQLVDARSDAHLWSATFDRELEDIFAIQDEIAAEVMTQLKITLLGEAPRVTQMDPEVYALLLRARHLFNDFEPENDPEAEALLRQALDRDPRNVHVLLELATAQSEERRIRELVARAEALDPDSEFLPTWHAWMALTLDDDLAAAARHLVRAMELTPTDEHTQNLARRIARTLGRSDEAIALAEYQIERDPMCFECRYGLSVLYREVGRLDEAESAVRALQVLMPDSRLGISHAGTLLLKGEAQAVLDTVEAIDRGPQMLGLRAMALHELGRRTEFNAAFAELRRGKWTGDERDQQQLAIAQVYAWIGQPDVAFEWLDKLLRDRRKIDAIEIFRRYPGFTRLRADPRWHALQETLGIAPEQLAAIEFKIKLPQ